MSRNAADLHALECARYLKASAFDLTEEEFSRIIHATASVDVTVASEVCDGLQALSTAEEPVFSAGFDSILKADGDAGEPSWIGAGYLVLQAAMYGMEPDKNGAAPSLRVLLPLLHEVADAIVHTIENDSDHIIYLKAAAKLLGLTSLGVNDSSLRQTIAAAIQRQEAAENRLPLIIPSLDWQPEGKLLDGSKWFVDRLIPRGMSAIWHAKPKQGKTLLTATLLAKAAVGDPSIADFVKVRPDRIIFLADDGGRWSQTLGWMRTAVRNVPGGLDELESRLRIFPRFKLIQEEHKKAVYDLVKNGGEVVVVADCLVSINDGYDTSENDSSFTRPLRRFWNKVQQLNPSASAIFIGHENKSGRSRGTGEKLAVTAMNAGISRGAGGLMTVDYYSTSVAEPYKFNLSLVCDGVEDDITSIDLKLKGVAMVDRSKAEPAKPATKPNEAKVLKLLEGKSEGMLVAEIAKAVYMDPSNCGRLLGRMAERDLVVCEGPPKRYRKP